MEVLRVTFVSVDKWPSSCGQCARAPVSLVWPSTGKDLRPPVIFTHQCRLHPNTITLSGSLLPVLNQSKWITQGCCYIRSCVGFCSPPTLTPNAWPHSLHSPLPSPSLHALSHPALIQLSTPPTTGPIEVSCRQAGRQQGNTMCHELFALPFTQRLYLGPSRPPSLPFTSESKPLQRQFQCGNGSAQRMGKSAATFFLVVADRGGAKVLSIATAIPRRLGSGRSTQPELRRLQRTAAE